MQLGGLQAGGGRQDLLRDRQAGLERLVVQRVGDDAGLLCRDVPVRKGLPDQARVRLHRLSLGNEASRGGARDAKAGRQLILCGLRQPERAGLSRGEHVPALSLGCRVLADLDHLLAQLAPTRQSGSGPALGGRRVGLQPLVGRREIDQLARAQRVPRVGRVQRNESSGNVQQPGADRSVLLDERDVSQR